MSEEIDKVTFCMTTWGSPKLPKKALMLHSSSGSGLVWYRIAQVLVQAGKCVHAPDRPGMGWSSRPKDCTITPSARYIAYHLSEVPYDLIIGQAMGGPLALRLLEFLEHKPRRVVLVDPPFGYEEIDQSRLDALARTSENTPSEEELLMQNKEWTREEALIKRFNGMRSDVEGMYSFLSDIRNGIISHSLLENMRHSPGTEILICAGDPICGGMYKAEHFRPMVQDQYPGVKVVILNGAVHDMHRDQGDRCADVILNGTESKAGITVVIA